jgi:Ca2+-binding RTX toxin-like protein
MTRKVRTKNHRRPLWLEALEDRTVLDASFGFEVVGGSLYFNITGDDSVNNVVLSTVAADNTFTINFIDDDGELQSTGGTVSAGEIALAQLLTGKAFAGFHVVTLGANDTVDAKALTNHSLWAEGGAGNDTINSGTRQDKLEGGTGNDTINGNSGADVIDGGDGNDTLNGDSGADVMTGGTGNDVMTGGTGNDTMSGGDGHDTLTGNAGADSLSGNAGNDIINSDAADVVISGGTGGETKVAADNGGKGDILNMSEGDAIVNADFEVVNGSGGNDKIDNTPFVGGGAFAGLGTTVSGNAGDDYIISSAFADTLDGGANGAPGDTLSYETSPAGVQVDLSLNSAAGGNAAGDKISNFENLTGSNSNDDLTGSGVANVLLGLGGDDTMQGLNGNDIMDGGAGDDAMDGGFGNDNMTGGAGNDGVDGGFGNDTLNINFDEPLNLGDAFFGSVGSDVFRFFGITHVGGVPVEAEVAASVDYLDDLLDLGQADWDATSDAPLAFDP